MTIRIRIIGVASGVGAQDKGCEDGPVAFHRSQAWHELEHHPFVDWGETLFAVDTPGHAPVARIAELCRRLADSVGEALDDGAFPLIIGGDHSIAIGTWSGVARFVGAPVGLLWIDAHLDSHTPETSYSGAIHGMPLACLLGRGDKRLLGLGLSGVQLDPLHTVVLGPRSWEPEEAAFLARMGVRVIGEDEIGARGIAACFAEAAAIVDICRHDIAFRDEDDFTIINQTDLLSIFGDITGVLTIFLGAIAAISLLVGGIGIMNIMLVSVTERTREIGIRKAVGAKRRDILLQFLIESMVLALIGGVLGVLMGTAGALGVSG